MEASDAKYIVFQEHTKNLHGQFCLWARWLQKILERQIYVYIYGILQKYKSQVASSITFCVVCMFYLLLGGASKKRFVWKLPQNTILGLERVKICLQTKQFILFCFVYRSVTHISKFAWLKVKFNKRYTFHCSTALLKSHRGENKTLSNILSR